MHVLDMIAMAMEVMGISFYEGDNDCVRSSGDGDGSEGHFLRIQTVMHVIDVMAMVMEVMDIVIGLKI